MPGRLCFDLAVVTIKASLGRQIDALIAELSSANATTRDAAVARLTVLGPRTVDKLITVGASAAPGFARVAARQAPEASASPRAMRSRWPR